MAGAIPQSLDYLPSKPCEIILVKNNISRAHKVKFCKKKYLFILYQNIHFIFLVSVVCFVFTTSKQNKLFMNF
ncbi:hypothetical protein Q7I58_22920, partial [Escherichia coli]|uniref:hypothetical protein n=1 Tax=Escherichia coli TaxID=562 RepID=UPI003EE5142C